MMIAMNALSLFTFTAMQLVPLISLFAMAAETKPPSDHFDLSHWKLTLPSNASGTAEGKPAEIAAAQLSAGYANERFFYTGTNGEMVLWCPVTISRSVLTSRTMKAPLPKVPGWRSPDSR